MAKKAIKIDPEIKTIIDKTTEHVIRTLSSDKHSSCQSAQKRFLNSRTCAVLGDPSTGLWQESVPYIVSEYKKEMKDKRHGLVQLNQPPSAYLSKHASEPVAAGKSSYASVPAADRVAHALKYQVDARFSAACSAANSIPYISTVANKSPCIKIDSKIKYGCKSGKQSFIKNI